MDLHRPGIGFGFAGRRLRQEKTAPPPPPRRAPPPAPTAMLTANPNSIIAGQASTLTWNTDFATDVSIDDYRQS